MHKAVHPTSFGHLNLFTLETARDSKSLFVCGGEHILYANMYIELIVCTKQTTYTGIPQCLMLKKKTSASKPAYYYLIFLIRCNIKLQYVCLYLLLLPPSFFALFKRAPPSSSIFDGTSLNKPISCQ